MQEFVEYIKIHIISLEQDLEDAKDNIPLEDFEHYPSDEYYEGAINTCRHLLSVAQDILAK